MEEKRNAYEIIGTNKVAIDRIKEEYEKDRFIEEKAKLRIKILRDKSERNKDSKAYFEEEIEKIEKAYEKVYDKAHREKYNALLGTLEDLERGKQQNRKKFLDIITRMESFDSTDGSKVQYQQVANSEYIPSKQTQEKIEHRREKRKTAYEILETTREKCDDRKKSSQAIDKFLLDRKEGLIQLAELDYEKACKNKGSEDFVEKQKSRVIIGKIKEAYEKVCTKSKREAYDKEIEQMILEEKYNVRKEYEPNIIQEAKFQKINDGKIKILYRKNGQEISLRKTGRVVYRDFRNLIGEIEQYQISRRIEGKERIDTIYTNLVLGDLDINEKTGEYQNEQYYNYITDELLSEESIEQCNKYNKGYVGQALLKKDETYFTDLRCKEEISAVMKIENDKEVDREQKNEEGEGRE